jgi:hypothetical protein
LGERQTLFCKVLKKPLLDPEKSAGGEFNLGAGGF